ncbi:MAG: hypothetical protein NZ750_02240 [Anaerolineae bacterium]|nr:hypothetical protein [Anaerolineae bacterium]MDW8173501.1 hypothetical protein [Anaerolineae bacterium]
MPSETPLRRWRAPLLALAFGLGLSLLLVELVGRALGLLPIDPPESFYALRAAVGTIPEPYQRFTYAFLDEFRTPLRFNYRSLRDVDHDYARASGQTRVMFLGDSFTAAWQVTLEQSYVGQLRARLAGQPVELINAGWHGWGNDRQWLFYRTEGHKYAPDAVVLQVYAGNDLIDNGALLWSEKRLDDGRRVVPHPLDPARAYVRLDDSDQLIHVPPQRLPLTETERVGGVRSWLRRYSVVYRLLDGLLSASDDDSAALPAPPDDELPLEYYGFSPQAAQDSEWQAAEALTLALLRAIRREVEAHDGRLVVMLVESRWLLDDESWQALRRERAFPPDWQAERMGAWWRAVLAQEDIPVLETLPALRDHAARTGRVPSFRHDGHWTAEGHCVVAELLHAWLSEQSLWPAPNQASACG